jgi:hypothetical protein
MQVGTHPSREEAALVTVTGLRRMPGWTFHVSVLLPPDAGRPRVLAVEASAPDGDAITAQNYRRIPIGEVIRLAVSGLRSPLMALVAESLGTAVGPRPYGGDVEHLKAVATLYRTALSQGLPVLDAVAEMLGVTTKTVSRYLSEARKTPDPETGEPILRTHAQERAAVRMTV